MNRTGPEYTIETESPILKKQPTIQTKLELNHRNNVRRIEQKPIVTQTKKQYKGIPEGLTRDKLIEGIILSEICRLQRVKEERTSSSRGNTYNM